MLSKNIKVLYPILHYPPVIGGLEQWSKNIAERQADDIEVFVVTGRVKGEPDFEKKGNVSIVRTSLFALSDLSHSSLLYIAGAVPFIFFRSLLLSKDARAFHCHGFVSAITGYFLSVLTGKSFICTEQSIKLRNTASRYIAAVVYRKAAVCIGSSRAVAEEFKKVGVKNISIIPNGVDFAKFLNVRGSTPHIRDEFVILSVGRLEKVKGHKYLIEAFVDVKREIPGARLVLVGDGSERGNLEKQADELGMGEDIEFVGERAHDELPDWYNRADIFVMPSLSEGFGIAIIEAMASGLPVVATRVGGILDIIEDGVTGFLVEPKNSIAIRDSAVKILQSSEMRKRISDNAGYCVLQYNWDTIAQKVSLIYRSVL